MINVYRVIQRAEKMKEHPLVACYSDVLPSMIRQHIRLALCFVTTNYSRLTCFDDNDDSLRDR